MTKTFAIIPVSRFSHAKTRLSPTLTASERENLLKSMIKDVINILKKTVDQVVVISSDKDVLDCISHLNVLSLKERGETDLNGALHQAVDWCSPQAGRVLIVPSDVPLIQEHHVKDMMKLGEEKDVVIAPAKGGGTNALLCPSKGMKMKFGDWSFFEHIKEAQLENFSWGVYDSFYLSLDVNTAEDLGEIIIHGVGTHTRVFLKEIGLKALSNHGTERIRVIREV
jgi:2-phospho-L-lactate/phosphoenolpyruvate guanylyltransferase